ncbi:MAG: adenylyltransferase/cytidyltransferase family protein [Flavobacteriaceae bacterium]|nr:adenylyltransferase/cytidyltransferase family protein [Flavobacteriaceae bacterium]
MTKQKGIIVSGYFNPLHKGHLEYINIAKSMADCLFVIVNNDKQRALKGSKEFQAETERLFIVSNLKAVDHALLSVDYDRSVCDTIAMIAEKYAENYNLNFANGGDQNNQSIPEISVCKKYGIKLIDGLGDKIQSSSWLLKKQNIF